MRPGTRTVLPLRAACEKVGIQLSGDGSLDKDYEYSRSPGHLDFEDTKNVPLTTELIPANSAKLVRETASGVEESGEVKRRADKAQDACERCW